MKIKILLLALLFLSQFNLKAQNIFLDTAFAGTSRGHKTFTNLSGQARAVAVDGQGKIFMAVSGSYGEIFVIRLKPDGASDATAPSIDTIATIKSASTSYVVGCINLQPDGKILLGGSTPNPEYFYDGNVMMIIRLNPDGSPDPSFGPNKNGYWIKSAPFNTTSSVKKMALQSDGKIIVAATLNDTVHTYDNIYVQRLLTSGDIDPGFTIYRSFTGQYEYTTGLDLHKDTIIVGGGYDDYYNQSFSSLITIKLLPNGGKITGGNWSNGRIEIPTNTTVNQGIGGIAVQTDGDIIFGFSESYSGFHFAHIGSNGSSSTYTIPNSANGYLTNVLLDNDHNIILTGYTPITNNYYTAIKVDESAMLDSTFAVDGVFNLGGGVSLNYKSYHSAFSKDHNLLLVGEADSSYTVAGNNYTVYKPSITKILISPPIHILGSEYVLPNSSEDYKVLLPPALSNYTFKWTSMGPNSFIFPNTTTLRTTTMFFGGSATRIRLYCTATPAAGAPGTILRTYKDIFVNKTPTSANELDSLQCSVSVTNCATGYIDYFKLNQIRNDSTGCSPNGYADYTQSSMIDTLVVGGVYSATLRVDEPRVYVGIWIDYNNDGIFNTSDEFVAEHFSDNTFIQMNDIILKNETGYFGPKRMRVRCRANTAFNSVDACPSAGEGGETEDYLVVLGKQEELAAPQIITPNEDGLNDYFVIRGIKPDKDSKLTVFDRVGSLKFSTSNYENNWNGIDSKGGKLLSGTYYYVFTHDGKSIKGFFELRY